MDAGDGCGPLLNHARTENVAEYILFLPPRDVAAKTTNASQLAQYASLRKQALDLADSLAGDYIWQRDGFDLETVHEHGMHTPLHQAPTR